MLLPQSLPARDVQHEGVTEAQCAHAQDLLPDVGVSKDETFQVAAG